MTVIITYLLAGPVVSIKPIEQMDDTARRERLLDDPLEIPPFPPLRGIEDGWLRRILIAFILIFVLNVLANAATRNEPAKPRHRGGAKSDLVLP